MNSKELKKPIQQSCYPSASKPSEQFISGCYPYVVDGTVKEWKSPLGGEFQGDVFNRYDAPPEPPRSQSTGLKYPTYQALYSEIQHIEKINDNYHLNVKINPNFLSTTTLPKGEYVLSQGLQGYEKGHNQKFPTPKSKTNK